VPSLFDGKVIVGASSGVRAQVKRYVDATASTPLTFYISYTSGGSFAGVPTGILEFLPGEELYILNA
jgi:hypothetical protein